MNRIILLAVIIAGMVALPTTAFAGGYASHDGTDSTTRTTVIFAPGLMIGTTFLTTTGGMSTSFSSMTASLMTSTRGVFRGLMVSAEMTAYLRENNRQLSEGVLMGGGQALDDLAHLLDVPEEEYEQFARDVRAKRDELLPYLHDDLDMAEATAFVLGVLNAGS